MFTHIQFHIVCNYSAPSSQYLVDGPLASITSLSFFFAQLLRLCPVAQGSDVDSSFQAQPQFLYWIEVWALTRPFQDITLVVFKPFLCSFHSILQVVVLLENKSSPKPLFSCRLNQGALQDFPICCCIHFTLYLCNHRASQWA